MKVNEYAPAVAAMEQDWKVIDDLLGGTRAMRAAGETYMPRRPMEEPGDYEARLRTATLFPALAETIVKMTGRMFSEPMLVGEDVPAWIREEVEPDVDLQGRNLHVWAREWFREALSYGLSHCLVEAPAAEGVKTLQDQVHSRARPYLIRVHPRDVLGWKTRDGELVQVRIRFTRIEEDGEWGEKEIEQVRVYEIGRVRTFEAAGEGDFIQVAESAVGLDRIPLITLYTHRTGVLTAAPPLLELAHLNAKHWRAQSSNDTLIDTASVPILTVAGVSDGDDIVIGAKQAVRLPTGGELKYTEHTGAAIGAGRDALRDLVDDMRRIGAKLLQPADTTKTATEAREEAASDNSQLGGMATQLQDTLIDVLDLVAEYRGQDTGGSVTVRPNLDPDPTPAASMELINRMADHGRLSDETVFTEAQRRGLVAGDITWPEEAERIAAQGM